MKGMGGCSLRRDQEGHVPAVGSGHVPQCFTKGARTKEPNVDPRSVDLGALREKILAGEAPPPPGGKPSM